MREMNGLLKKFDLRDYVFEVLEDKQVFGDMLTEIPDTFSLRDKLFHVKNQGPDGACVAFAISNMKDVQERADSKIESPTAPAFIYNLRKNYPKSGMYFTDAFGILRKYGIALEQTFPYKPGVHTEPSFEVKKEASNYRVLTYAKITSVEGIKKALLNFGPVVMGSNVYSYDTSFWDSSLGKKSMGRHATTIVGWDSDSFIAVNSWGDKWGDDGFAKIPFDKISQSHLEFWSAVDIKTGEGKKFSTFDFIKYRLGLHKIPLLIFASILASLGVYLFFALRG